MEGSRRSSAIQFYVEDDSQSRDREIPKTLYEQVIMLLSEATLSIDPNTRIELIASVKDIVLNKEPALLDTFLPEILQFQNDRNVEVRKFVVCFIEEAIKKDCDVMPNLIQNVQSLLQDRAPAVQKRIVQCIRELYKTSLLWLSRAPTVTNEMQRVWSSLTNMKAFVINMVDCENEGLRGQIIKFMEKLILLQTYPEPDSQKRDNDFSLEDIPLTLKVARRRKLEEEAMTVFDLMIKFYGSPHISSGNMMTCMGSLSTIAKLRPSFMGKVITALETLHLNLPPSLTTTQVNSVRKHLKMQLLGILKHPAAVDYITNITTLLTDLGATTSEVNKVFPKMDELKKRARKATSESAPPAKKSRLDETSSIPDSAIDITEAFVLERLSPELAAQLVIVGMNRLPETMPPIFSATYTPIAAAGTQGQIKHVSRLLATQLTAAGLGPGASVTSTQMSKPSRPPAEDDDDDELAPTTIVPAGVEEDETAKGGAPPAKNLKLEVSKPLNSELRDNLQSQAIARILRAQESAITGGVSAVRQKIISSVAASFNLKLRQEILRYVLSDIRNQLNLALSWVYEEFSYMQGFSKRPPTQTGDSKSYDFHYDQLVCTLVNCVINNRDLKDRETILTRLYLEMPVITDESTDILGKFSSSEVLGLNIVNKIIQIKPPKQMIFLRILLECTSHQTAEIRETAISHVVDLYPREEMQKAIEEHGLYYLTFLKLPVPPTELFGPLQGRSQRQDTWTDEYTKACLYLFLSLLPINQELIHELAKVYIQTAHADVKRAILRVVEHPVKAMGMDSPELLKLVEECPKGSETLVTRLIQILTDKSAPSPELVAIVRELYQTRVSDVRFLIPVLNGLTKNEVIAALPKLIKLNPIVVKEVFNRLLCTSNDGGSYSSPVTPADLLIALHTIDTTKCELKTVIKATSLCFNDKQAYTQEVLAVVMQHLMEITPLPTLLMRTVIQALSLYPRLIGFVMNILQRLILKQVWKQKKVWEGFIKCCQRAQPHSFQVLLQLPAQQLEDVFQEAPDLKKPLLDHIMEFTENQRAHIPQSVMDILLGPANSIENNNFTIKEEPLSPPHDLMIDIKEEMPDDVAIRVYSQPAPPGLD